MRSAHRLRVLEYLRAGEDVLIVASTPRMAAREALTIKKLADAMGVAILGRARVVNEMISTSYEWEDPRPAWLGEDGRILPPPFDPDSPPYKSSFRWI